MTKDLLRVGIVDGVNIESGTIRVTFPDRDDSVVDDIALLKSEQWCPKIDDPVLVGFLSNGTQQGFCFGPYFNDEEPNYIADATKYVKQLEDGLQIQYDFTTKELTVHASKPITLNGNFVINGNLTVNGTIN